MAVTAATLSAFSAPGAGFRPLRVLDIELSRPLPVISGQNAARTYGSAQVLVRLHGHPLGQIVLDLSAGELRPEDYRAQVWQVFEAAIRGHLQQDGLPAAADFAGLLAPVGTAPCEQRRQRFLAAAPRATVVICTRDRTDQLALCLPALLDQHYPAYEVILVDNAPQTTATADLVRDRYRGHPRLRYVREERPGLSIARNTALRLAQGEVIAYTDDDVQADPHWLAELALALANRPDAACATGFTAPAALETAAQAWYERFGGFNKGRAFERVCFNMTDARPPEPLYPYLAARFGAGVNMAYRTEVLRALGGFDEALGAGTPSGGGEDIEAFFRCIMNGYTLVYEPAAVLRHYHRADYGSLRKQLHNQGIAFTAFLTRSLLDDPRRLAYLIGRLPHAARYFWGAESPRNRSKGPGYPAELTRTESAGMLYGPIAYLRSRRRVQRLYKAHGQAGGALS